MPDTFDANGLTVETASEITTKMTNGLQGIYGADINVAQNSPDGEAIGIQTQAGVDVRELAVEVNNSFDPDNAVGVTLDQRCAINGVIRNGASYSIYPITIVTSKTVALQGLDANFNSSTGTGYMVTDGNGNNFILVDSVTLTAGTSVQNFRAQLIGPVSVSINTITIPVTIVSGVTSVNNASAAISVGDSEETDPQLRVRRQKSVSKSSQGYLNGLIGALVADVAGVIDADGYENVSETTDANGIPPHGIWIIVDGGANTDIANMIFSKKGYGCPMKGSVEVDKLSPSGVTVPIFFDRPIAETLYLKYTIKTTTAGFDFDTDSIAANMAANLSYEVGAFAETSIATQAATNAIAATGGGGVPVLMQVSTDGISYTDYVTPTSPQYQFTLAAENIDITVVT